MEIRKLICTKTQLTLFYISTYTVDKNYLRAINNSNKEKINKLDFSVLIDDFEQIFVY